MTDAPVAVAPELLRFAVVAAFVPTAELAPLARAADELGYDALCLGDHVVDLETIETPYPYSSSGERRWDTAMEWPDPWVMAGNLAAVTQRLSFFTSIYVTAMRNPYVVAKAVGTAAVVSGGRVKLGVGVGWCREEFELLEADFSTRGKRTDEALALLRRLWTEPWVSSEGPFYPAPRLTMRPMPPVEVPILVGGLSDVAIRRAARHDGWISDIMPTDDAIAVAGRLAALRDADAPRAEVVVALNDALVADDFARAAVGGVTEVMTQPWYYYHGRDASLEQKIDGLERFKRDVLDPLRG
ncbi:putative F420-dependent oxidoreductase [Nocardioides massiliensis]|uniref:F420-dependent oxidoreductase n=3 Tax=Nocardioides massiliensis TaxID=1325935 RepID=A0ABT9NUV7_9ACTN|nr:TIGR03619 family F420-dependent LLM class oxidoreductase [Nocardioides massiliensis]MDP9823785.1 putative F420-dependent oxidoreductase [Nocardioides massiliensis]